MIQMQILMMVLVYMMVVQKVMFQIVMKKVPQQVNVVHQHGLVTVYVMVILNHGV